MRSVLRDWMPPRLWDWARARFGGVWRVSEWPDSAAGGWGVAATTAAEGYVEGVRRMTEGAALAYLSTEEPAGWFSLDPQFHNRMVQFGFVAARASSASGTLNILDYGGGFGGHANALRRLLPMLRFQYTVCELPSFCEQGRKLNREIHFVSSLQEAGKGYDLVYASSSVQYTRDWRRLLRELCAASKGCLFVTRTPFVVNGPSFIVMQRAYNTQYAGWVLNKNEFVEEVHAASPLRLQEVFVNGCGLAVRGAPEPNVHLGMLFGWALSEVDP